jgi:hypothetical protein
MTFIGQFISQLYQLINAEFDLSNPSFNYTQITSYREKLPLFINWQLATVNCKLNF